MCSVYKTWKDRLKHIAFDNGGGSADLRKQDNLGKRLGILWVVKVGESQIAVGVGMSWQPCRALLCCVTSSMFLWCVCVPADLDLLLLIITASVMNCSLQRRPKEQLPT